MINRAYLGGAASLGQGRLQKLLNAFENAPQLCPCDSDAQDAIDKFALLSAEQLQAFRSAVLEMKSDPLGQKRFEPLVSEDDRAMLANNMAWLPVTVANLVLPDLRVYGGACVRA